MIDPVRNAWAAATSTEPQSWRPVSHDRQARFESAMIAAALRPPMIDLTAANGGPDEREQEALVLPIRPPVVAVTQ